MDDRSPVAAVVSAATRWTDVEVVAHLHSELGEGPIWDHRRGSLMWVDILGGLVHETEPESGVTTSVPTTTVVGAIALAGDDQYLAATQTGFGRFDGRAVAITHEFLPTGQRMNDGAVDPGGRFVAGSITEDRSPNGRLYRLETDGEVTALMDGVTVSNGLAWSGDGRRLFYVDSQRQTIDVMDYDPDTGAVGGRRSWVEIPPTMGTPDGLTIDADGCLWLALWGGSAVVRFSPAGQQIGRVELPVSRVTSCAFGGRSLERLFITTAAVGDSRDDPPRPLDGALFAVEPGCAGVPSVVAGTVA